MGIGWNMIDTIALLIDSIETTYAVLGVLIIVCAGAFATLLFSLKRNHLHLNNKDVKRLWKFLIHSLTYDHNMDNIEIAYIENVSQKPERCYNCGSYDLNFDAIIALSANTKKDIPIKDVGTAYCANCKSLMIHPENS